ncbi:MAG: hypothetical protein D6790_08625 [Caldilineae bacterium]|nr:MAG: hypothetical protein D6790_08625 [Caldilineae bacterium]
MPANVDSGEDLFHEQLRIFLFGGLRVFLGETPLPPFPTQKSRALFVYLLLNRDQVHTRSRLAGLFWGDSPEIRARRSLNTALWRLRRIVPSALILTDADAIRLNPDLPYWLDVAAFEALLATPYTPTPRRMEALERATELYRDGLLPGWYEDWVLIEAERLRLLHWQALRELMDLYEQSAALDRSLHCGLRLLAADPLHEETHRRVMDLYARCGQREAALAQFSACVQLLQEELGLEPSPETVALADAIRQGNIAPAGPLTPPSPPAEPQVRRSPFDDFGHVALVGRRAELAWIHAHVERAHREGCRLALLEGEAGVGKTRLLQEAAKQAEARGALVLWGRCLDMHAPPPYQSLRGVFGKALARLRQEEGAAPRGAWSLVLGEWLAEPADSAAEAGAALPGPDVHVLWQAMVACLHRLSQTNVSVILLEDLQWADDATLEALAYLTSHLGAASVLFLASVRPEETADHVSFSRLAAALTDAALLERRSLGRLTSEESVELVRQILGLGEEDHALARFIVAETEGNPFFIGEMLKLLVEEDYLRLDSAGRWTSPWDWDDRAALHLHPARTIRQTLERRLAHLPSLSRSLLEMAAVLGNRFDYELLHLASGQAEDMLLEISDDLFRRQLLTEEENGLAFSHDKIRQVAYHALPEVRRRHLHRRAGEALAQLHPGRVEELAYHFYRAHAHPETIRWGMRAMERARRLYAYEAALTYLDWVIDAARQLGSAQSGKPMMRALEARGEVRARLGLYDEALTDFTTAQALAASLGDRSGVARAMRLGAWVQGNYLGDWAGGLDHTQRAWQIAQEAHDVREAALAQCNLGACYNMQGAYDQAQEAYRLAQEGFRALGDDAGEARTLEYLAVTEHFLGRLDRALATDRQALAIWERLDKRYEAAHTRVNIGYLLIDRGDLALAEQEFVQATAALREIGAIPVVLWALIGLGAVHRYRGDFQRGMEALNEADHLLRELPSNPYNRALICSHRGGLHWTQGHLSEALTQMNEAVRAAREAGEPALLAGLLIDLGRALRLHGDAPSAALLHQEAYTLARRTPFRAGAAWAESEWGLDEVCNGDWSAGLAHLRAALIAAEGVQGWKRLMPRLNLAEGLLHTGQAAEALPLARQVVDQAASMGMCEVEAQGQLTLDQTLLALKDRPEL